MFILNKKSFCIHSVGCKAYGRQRTLIQNMKSLNINMLVIHVSYEKRILLKFLNIFSKEHIKIYIFKSSGFLMWGLTIFPVFLNSEVINKSIIFLTDAKKTEISIDAENLSWYRIKENSFK